MSGIVPLSFKYGILRSSRKGKPTGEDNPKTANSQRMCKNKIILYDCSFVQR